MRKRLIRETAYALCAALVITAVPWAVYADNTSDKTKISSSKVATASEADRDTSEEDLSTSPSEEQETDREEGETATPSYAVESVEPTFVTVKTVLAASLLLSSSFSFLGDIWDSWSGKTSFEFLSGSQGEGTEEKPYLIKTKAQLMGLSELAAMGMTVPEAEGADYAGNYSGCYFALGSNIDLQGVSWIPIGFYRDSSENSGEVPYPFSGIFNGNGYYIKNLKLTSFAGYNNVGLFGSVKEAVIENVTIIPDSSEIKGNDRTGVVAGYAEDSIIKDVTVKNAYISSTGISGGIAGE